MKIALLTDGVFPYVIGGMQKHSFQLAKFLAANGHTVILFHCNESKYDISKLEFFTPEERQNIKSFVIPFPHKISFPFHYLYESWLYSKAIKESLLKVINEVDFIFAQGFCAWALLTDKGIQKIPPVAVHFHGLEMFQYVPSLKSAAAKYVMREAVKKNIRKADYTISFGGKITRILNQIVPKEKIWETPGWIDGAWVTQNKNQKAPELTFVFVGRYERRKGVKELQEAIKSLLAQYNFNFHFIGSIPEEFKIASPKIHYHGQVSSEIEIKKILSQSDILVCPSYAEGMPYVIMEAMCCGLAIIATDVGAVEVLVAGDNGWLLESPEPANIAKSMKKAIELGRTIIEQKKSVSSGKIKQFFMNKISTDLVNKIENSVKIIPNS